LSAVTRIVLGKGSKRDVLRDDFGKKCVLRGLVDFPLVIKYGILMQQVVLTPKRSPTGKRIIASILLDFHLTWISSELRCDKRLQMIMSTFVFSQIHLVTSGISIPILLLKSFTISCSLLRWQRQRSSFSRRCKYENRTRSSRRK